jgi:hypothetical protein
MITKELNNQTVSYDQNTVFKVQIGKKKSAYKDKYKFFGDLTKAVFYYDCINIGKGFKKRLIIDKQRKPLLVERSK